MKAGLSLVLCNSDDDPPGKEARYLTIAAEREHGRGPSWRRRAPRPRLDPARRPERPWSSCWTGRSHDDVDQIYFDNVALGREATTAAAGAVAQRIACITGPSRIATAADRAAGWRTAHDEAGLPVDPDLLRHANYRVDGGRVAMESLLSLPDPPDAVLATNNMVGVGALQVLSRLSPRRRVHVGVIGDLPYWRRTSPTSSSSAAAP